jgi:serine carboxypeptidase 1
LLPTVVWLQGGPGASGTGYGNFAEIGPLDRNLAPRPSTWLNAPVNLLFLDSPVGSGYSYVDSPALFATTNAQIAADAVAVLGAYLAATPSARAAPLYIFTESYGGKMATDISLALLAAIDAGTVRANFAGVVLGDSWISGVDSVLSWPVLLRATALLDGPGVAAVDVPAQACAAAVAAGDWAAAINAWGAAENVISEQTDGVDFYNILKHGSAGAIERHALSAPPGVSPGALAALFARHVGQLGDPIDDLMNGPVRKKLNSGPAGVVIPANVTWGGQSSAVFSALSLDFMRPVTASLDALLSSGRVNVTVEEGQVDLICSSVGADYWMAKLTWPGMAAWSAAPRVPRYPSPAAKAAGLTGAFVKRAGVLTRYDVLSAGHMIPLDAPLQALCMVRELTGRAEYDTLCA